MRRVLRLIAVCAVCVAEPVLHAAGVPHPEGLSSMALNFLATQTEEV